MPTATVQSILDKAAILLQDATKTRWPTDEMLGWLNDAQRAIVLRKPNAFVKNVILKLVVGTFQSLPPDAVQLIDISRNENGPVITGCKRAILDAGDRNWYRQSQQAIALHFCFDESNPKHFDVYPPNNGAGSVHLVYSASPPNVALGDVIALDDVYQPAILHYLLWMAYSKDAQFAEDAQRASNSMAVFNNLLSIKTDVEQSISPNNSAVNPSVRK